MKKTEREIFEIANDFNFSEACNDFHDNSSALQRNKFQTIGDRIRFIQELEKNGFTITKIKDL